MCYRRKVILCTPPIGLMPHDIYEEIANNERLHDVCGAITRYYNAGLPIKIEWIEEYNELISKKRRTRIHMSINLNGLLLNYKGKSMRGFFLDEEGNELSDAECREYITQCQAKGWKKIPMGRESACPDFDHFENGCPGHPIESE